jgi:hypothetical protein
MQRRGICNGKRAKAQRSGGRCVQYMAGVWMGRLVAADDREKAGENQNMKDLDRCDLELELYPGPGGAAEVF